LKKKISEKDKKDWQNFLDKNDSLENKDEIIFKKKSILKRSVDLHGCSMEDANQKIKKIINESFLNGIKKINVITGKGLRSKNLDNPYQSKDLAILKYSVPNFIKNDAELMSKILSIDFDAVDSASKGSFLIILKNKK